MNIYVGNFTELMTETTLRQIFEAFGAVDSVKIIKNRFNGRSRGYGFVEMPSNSEADKAIKALNGNMINKKPLIIKQGDSSGKKKKKKFKRRSY
jgi:RNA recognition motif-containing protein